MQPACSEQTSAFSRRKLLLDNGLVLTRPGGTGTWRCIHLAHFGPNVRHSGHTAGSLSQRSRARLRIAGIGCERGRSRRMPHTRRSRANVRSLTGECTDSGAVVPHRRRTPGGCENVNTLAYGHLVRRADNVRILHLHSARLIGCATARSADGSPLDDRPVVLNAPSRQAVAPVRRAYRGDAQSRGSSPSQRTRGKRVRRP
jgi:hypothetical protein